MDFQSLVQERYATKKFDGRTIPDSILEQLFEMIRLAPTAYNLQAYNVIVVSTQDMKQALAPTAGNQAQITTCSHLLVLCADTDVASCADRMPALLALQGRTPEQTEYSLSALHNFLSKLTSEQKLCWTQRQVYIVLAYATLGAKALGLDSCPIEAFEPERLARVLGLPAHLVPTVLCAVGYAADVPRKKARFPKEQLFQTL